VLHAQAQQKLLPLAGTDERAVVAAEPFRQAGQHVARVVALAPCPGQDIDGVDGGLAGRHGPGGDEAVSLGQLDRQVGRQDASGVRVGASGAARLDGLDGLGCHARRGERTGRGPGRS